MNARSYKTVFSKRLGCLVAVGEHASSQGKANGAGSGGGASCALGYVAALSASFAFVSLAWAAPATNELPTFGQVVQGAASMSHTANQMTINQSTQRAIINWQSFNIGAGARVQVNQLNSQSVLLNRVVGQSPSQIFGQLSANGHVILVNPNGVLFGKDGSVNAAAFTASTLGISDANFKSGNMLYERNGSTAGIANQGTITTAPGGYVALLGASVSNEGKIETKGGNAFLAAADTIKVPVSGTGRIKLELTAADMNANVSNSGSIITEGGQVYMQALALNRAAAQIIQSGSIDTTGEQGGAVHVLAEGGTIRVDGRITANSTGKDNQGQARKGGDIVIGRDEETGALAKATDVSGAKLESQGGFLETSGHDLKIDGAQVKAANWLLDPDNIEITNGSATAGYSGISASTLSSALTGGTTITINTTAGSGTYNSNAGNGGTGKILVTDAIHKTSPGDATLNLIADDTITLNNSISSSGTGAGALSLTLSAAGVGGIGGSAAGTINTKGGLLTLNTSNAAATGTLAGVISGTGALTKTGAGTTTLSAANTYTGATTVSGGTLVFQNANASISYNTASGAVTEFNVASGTRDFLTNSNAVASFTGAGTLRKTGAGTIQWGAGAATFAMNAGGLIDVQAGTFVGGSNNNENWVNNYAGLNVASGAVFDGVEAAVRVDGLTGLGTVKAGYAVGYPGSITIGVANTNAAFAGVIMNSYSTGNLVKVGTGTQILTGVNIYTGTTTIKDGTLQVGNWTSGPANSASIGKGAVIIDGANSILSFKNNAAITLSSTQTITGNGQIKADGDLSINGKVTVKQSSVDGNNNLAITTTNTGASLTNGNIYLGAAIVKGDANSGTLTVTSANGISLNGNVGDKVTDGSNSTGTFNVNMSAAGGAAVAANSAGFWINKMIDANGGIVTLSGTNKNSHGVSFSGASGITAGSFSVTGTHASMNPGAWDSQRDGVILAGTNTFTSTGTSTITGSSNSGYFLSTGVYVVGSALNLNSGTGSITVSGTNPTNMTNGMRIDSSITTTSTGAGYVTLGNLDSSSSGTSVFQRSGTIQNSSGTLNILGSSFSQYNNAAKILGGNNSTLNIKATSVTLGATPVPASEGVPSIGMVTGATGFNLNVTADNFNSNNSGYVAPINVGTGTVTIANKTAATKIDIGGNDVSGASATLGVSNAELSKITAGKTIIGGSTAGNLTVSQATTSLAATGHIELRTGGNVAINAALTVGDNPLTAPVVESTKNLTINASGTVTQGSSAPIKASGLELLGTTAAYTLTNANNTVTNLVGNTGSVSYTNSGAMTVGKGATGLSTTGLTTTGAINLTASTAVASTSALTTAEVINSTVGGDITLTGTTTTASALRGVVVQNDIGSATAGAINITGTSAGETAVYQTGGTISSQKKITVTGTGNLGVNLSSGAVTALAGGAGFAAGTDAVLISGVSTLGNASVVLGNNASINNNSSGGATTVKGTTNWIALNGNMTNASTAGAINVQAGNGTANNTTFIQTTNTATITQNANADVLLTTDGTGNLQVAKINKTGTGAGKITVAAGKLIAGGTANGGQVATVSGNTITNNGTGNTYIYTGSTTGTSELSTLDSSLANLNLSAIGDGLTTNRQNADTNVGYGATIAGGQKTQVLFREKLTIGNAGLTGATANMTYGDANTANEQAAALLGDMRAALKAANSTSGVTNTITKTGLAAGTFKIAASALIDDLNGSLTGAAYSSSNYLKANPAGYSYGSLAGTKYGATLATGQAAKVTVQKKAVTYGGVGVGTKTYDGTDVANLTGTAALSTVAVGSSVSTDAKVLAGDKVALSGTVSGKYDTKNVLGTDANRTNNVTLTGPTLVAGSGGDDRGNYTFSQPTALAGKDTILARPVNIAVGTVADKTADGTTSATVTPGALGNLVQGESLTVLVAGANFSDANAGSGKVVTASYTLQDTASGLASNYVLNAGSPNPDSRLRGNILRSVNPVNPIISPVNNNGSSRVSTVAGSGASGAATGVLDDQPVNQAPQACSDLTPENCECQPSAVASIEICFAPKSVAVIKE